MEKKVCENYIENKGIFGKDQPNTYNMAFKSIFLFSFAYKSQTIIHI